MRPSSMYVRFRKIEMLATKSRGKNFLMQSLNFPLKVPVGGLGEVARSRAVFLMLFVFTRLLPAR